MSYKATNWAYEMKLSSPMKPVLVALADMADEAATCFPGQERLGEMTGLSVKTVARALRKLEVLGLISRARRYDQFGHRTSDRYRLHLSVTVPESLPDTLPTRHIAYKALSPSLTDSQSLPTGHSDRLTIREPSENHQGGPQLSPTCGKHPEGTTTNCRACGDARRQFDAQRQTAKQRPTPTPPRKADLCPEHEWNLRISCGEEHTIMGGVA